MAKVERYPWEGIPAGVPCWHVHHDMFLEWSTEPLDVRARYVREEKPACEVEVRLRLMRPVGGELPAEVVEAGRAYAEAWRVLAEAWRVLAEARRAHGDAWSARGEAWSAHGEALRAWSEARRAWNEAGRARDEAGRAWNKARRALDEAVERHLAEVEALHEEECPGCPWDGKTIFLGQGDAR